MSERGITLSFASGARVNYAARPRTPSPTWKLLAGWPGTVVNEVTPAGTFSEAEPEHQDYLERYPNGYTCHFVRPDWVLPQRTRAAAGQAR